MHSRTYVTVRYAETDRMGIAHHANFPIWFEIGRTDFIRLFDTTYTEMEEILPAQYEDRLVIRTWCTHISAARIEFSYTVKRINADDTQTELAYGSTEHGFVDAKTFRPCNAKKRMPELYEKMNQNIKVL